MENAFAFHVEKRLGLRMLAPLRRLLADRQIGLAIIAHGTEEQSPRQPMAEEPAQM